MYQWFYDLVADVSNAMYSYLLIILLLAVGVYFTFRTKFVQVRLLGESIRLVTEKSNDKAAVSPFQALMVSTASRVGTGNIVGVANAIAIGGYGAVFWMWIIAIIGGASAFIESTLAQIYKKRDVNGGSYGGPAYYIQGGLKQRWLGVIFAISLILTYAVGFNMLCSYNLIDSLSSYSFYSDKISIICGVALAILVGFCVLGGGKRIVKVAGVMVPVMGIGYILVALIVLVINYKMIPGLIQNIFVSAFDFKAIFGGFAGSALMHGIKRGLYSNEAGVGSAPNAAAAADVTHPVKQGLVQMLSVFIDTILICTATAFMCLSSGLVPNEGLKGAAFVQTALSSTFGSFGFYFVTVALLLFAFTTLIGNLFYCESCLNYLAKRSLKNWEMKAFYLVACVLIFAGAQLEFDLVWNLSDVIMGFMAIINLPVIVLLGKPALGALKDYVSQRKAGKNPVFKASSIVLEDAPRYSEWVKWD